jgi:hypothetical protein
MFVQVGILVRTRVSRLKLFTFTSILTDRIGAIEWDSDRPSQQIPNTAMILRVAMLELKRAIALRSKYQTLR